MADSSSYFTLRNLWRGIVALVALVLLWFLLSDMAFSQDTGPEMTTGGSFELEQWAGPNKTYMNRMAARVRLKADWGRLWGEGAMSGIWWGSRRSKISGSLWNTEAGKTIERRRSLALGVAAELTSSWSVRIGGIVQRRGIHHIWQYKRGEGRHDYFPGGWEAGVKGCNGRDAPDWPSDRPQCPSIGYWDTASQLVILKGQWKSGGIQVRIEAPMWTWKSLTLPYPRAQAKVAVRLQKWHLQVESQALGPAGFGYDLRVSRAFAGAPNVRLGLVASDHLPDPGWGKGPGDNLRRVGATLRIGSVRSFN